MTVNTSSPARRGRVYVLSTGAVTPYGTSADDLWKGVSNGEVVIRPVEHIETSGYTTRLGGEVIVDVPPSPVSRQVAGFRDRSYDFMFAAADDALAGHTETFATVPPERRGLVLGTCNGGMLSSTQWYRDRGGSSPLLPLYGPPQAMAESLAAHHDIRGPVLTINTACAAGANALGLAADLITTGESDVVLMGGSDGLADLSYAGFNSLGSLSPRPAAPYSIDRDGLSLGEGSGMILLVSQEVLATVSHAPIAEVLGHGLSADGYHPTAPRPDGTGAARAITAAMRDAGVTSNQVGYVNSHGTGTAKNDSAESNAMRVAIPEVRSGTRVSSTKSLIGHLLGAAGAVEAVVTIHALRDQLVPPTANLREADPECELRHVPNVAVPTSFDVAISNNFAFGGANASVVLASPDARPAPPRRERRGVAVTGLGAISHQGRGPDGLARPEEDRGSSRTEQGAPALSLTDHPYVPRRQLKRMDRVSSFAVLAAGDALHDADLTPDPERHDDEIGVLFGTGLGPMEAMEQFYGPVHAEGASAANPAVYPNLVYNAPAGAISTHLRTTGPTSTITTGHAAGASAVTYAADHVATARAGAMLATASDMLTEAVLDGYRGIGVPVGPDGVDLTEGAAALLLEDEERARARGARVYAFLLAHATASDARGPGRWDPRGRGVERAMRRTLETAGITPQDVDVVWTAACGWPAVDEPEKQALRRTFGTHRPRRCSFGASNGEALGASGAFRIAAAARELSTSSDTYAVVNSTSWGGTHVSVLLATPHPADRR